MFETARTQKEVDDLHDRCAQVEDLIRSQFPERSYEQGIADAICWMETPQMPDPLEP